MASSLVPFVHLWLYDFVAIMNFTELIDLAAERLGECWWGLMICAHSDLIL